MAALICILPKTLKGARVASSGFLISTLRYIRTAKKLSRDSNIRFAPQNRVLLPVAVRLITD